MNQWRYTYEQTSNVWVPLLSNAFQPEVIAISNLISYTTVHCLADYEVSRKMGASCNLLICTYARSQRKSSDIQSGYIYI